MTQRPKFTRKKKTPATPTEAAKPAAPKQDDVDFAKQKLAAATEARKAQEAAAAQEARAQLEAAERERIETQMRRIEEARTARAERDAQEKALAEAEAALQPEPTPVPDAEPVAKPAEVAAKQPEPAPVIAEDPAVEDVDAWDDLGTISLEERVLDKNRIITGSRSDNAHTTFDVLRTRLLQALADKGWSRVAITSPTQGCGKTFTAANLALSLSRQENCRTILMDFDLRRPGLAKTLGVENAGNMGDLLRGKVDPVDHLKRLGPNTMNAGTNIAFGLNDSAETYASELLLDPRTGKLLDELDEVFNPDVVLFDLPPALFSDDVLALRPHIDGVLLVVGGGLTTQAEIKEVESRLGGDTPLLGIVLNKAEGVNATNYEYY